MLYALHHAFPVVAYDRCQFAFGCSPKKVSMPLHALLLPWVCAQEPFLTDTIVLPAAEERQSKPAR